MRKPLLAMALLATVASTAMAQITNPYQLPFPIRHAALVHVRFLGPPGMQVTFYQGKTQHGGSDFAAPVNVGLRPGYIHRVKLSGFTDRPGLMLSPSIEIIDALCLPPQLIAAKFPVPVVLSEQDILGIAAGRYITKMIYLEDPEKALAIATKADQPLEMEMPPHRDLMFEAGNLGRPMLVVRIGTRDVSDKELMEHSIPNTILLPGQQSLGMPSKPPYLPWAGKRIFDPKLGSKPPTEECLHDGGDAGWPAGLDGQEQLHGVEPADTVAEFRDSSGRLQVTKSNRVCFCVPRFAVLRTELPLQGFDATIIPAGTMKVHGPGELDLLLPPRLTQLRVPPLEAEGRLRPSQNVGRQIPITLLHLDILQAVHIPEGLGIILDVLAVDRLTQVQRVQLAKQLELALSLSSLTKPAGVQTVVGTSVVGRVEGLGVVTQTMETRDLTVCCNEKPRPPDKPLVLWKWADRTSAEIGDVVTFTLKYTNHGGRPMTDIAVVDSLTGRLEYVPGSARSSRDAVFTLQENEVGSVTLRWEVSGDLQPGKSGAVSFQARVR